MTTPTRNTWFAFFFGWALGAPSAAVLITLELDWRLQVAALLVLCAMVCAVVTAYGSRHPNPTPGSTAEDHTPLERGTP